MRPNMPERKGLSGGVKIPRREVFPARLGELARVRSFLEGFCAEERLAPDHCLRLNVVLEELFVNTVQHGHKTNCEAPVWISLGAEAAGGLGVLLTRELAATRDYAYLFGRNRIRLSLSA